MFIRLATIDYMTGRLPEIGIAYATDMDFPVHGDIVEVGDRIAKVRTVEFVDTESSEFRFIADVLNFDPADWVIKIPHISGFYHYAKAHYLYECPEQTKEETK